MAIDDALEGVSFGVQFCAVDIVTMTLKREVYYYLPKDEKDAPKTQEEKDKWLQCFKLSIDGDYNDSQPSTFSYLTHDENGVVKLSESDNEHSEEGINKIRLLGLIRELIPKLKERYPGLEQPIKIITAVVDIPNRKHYTGMQPQNMIHWGGKKSGDAQGWSRNRTKLEYVANMTVTYEFFNRRSVS